MKKTLFIKVLGDSPKIRILDLLITGRELEYSISDIARNSGTGRTTFYRLMDEFFDNKLIIMTRKIGNIQLYKLNLQNDVVIELIRLYDSIIKIASEKEIEKQHKKKVLTVKVKR